MLFDTTDGSLRKIEMTSFANEGVQERRDLQQWLLKEPYALGENLFVIAEEFGDWDGARRRIDILALDEDANLVVIELKRTDDGGHMDLQAIRYAAMVSAMTFEEMVRTHEAFLRSQGNQENARDRIFSFLELGEGETPQLSTVPRIVLVSRDFSREITTTVLWLLARGLDIRCIQIEPYRVDKRLLVELRQVLPLKEASEYQVKIRQKDEVVRHMAGGGRRELTLSVLARAGRIQLGTQVEVMPAALPDDAKQLDSRIFRAAVVDLDGRESLQWSFDGNRYSASGLNRIIRERYGLRRIASKTFGHWRIVGDGISMWELSERLLEESPDSK